MQAVGAGTANVGSQVLPMTALAVACGAGEGVLRQSSMLIGLAASGPGSPAADQHLHWSIVLLRQLAEGEPRIGTVLVAGLFSLAEQH